MKMRYKIFLDDLRVSTDIYPDAKEGEWTVIRTLGEFKAMIEENGVPDYISFDNDLGESLEEGKDAVKWMVFEKGLDTSKMGFKAHSANTAGVREYIEGLLNNWNKELESNTAE